MEEKEGKKMKWRWFVALCILAVLPTVCFAAAESGYIRLRMYYDGKPVAGGTVTLYDVSDTPDDVGALEMLVYVRELSVPGVEKQVDTRGEVLFDNLPEGKYLLVQQKTAGGFYPVKPFLVRLSLVAGGTMVDRVEAAPKMEPEKKLPQTGQLLWPAWVMLAGGMILVGIGLTGRKRK